MPEKKGHEGVVTQKIIDTVHLTLSQPHTGEELVDFLRQTEPTFMREVTRFVQAEMSRMRFELPESRVLYLGSVIGAAYLSGFLIARETSHNIFDNTIKFSEPGPKMNQSKIDEIIDDMRNKGKSSSEIAKRLKKYVNENRAMKKKTTKSKTAEKRKLNITGLED